MKITVCVLGFLAAVALASEEAAESAPAELDYNDDKRQEKRGIIDDYGGSYGGLSGYGDAESSVGSYGSYGSYGSSYGHAAPLAQTITVAKPYAVPVVKPVAVPVPQPYAVHVPHAVPVHVPQPYAVPVPQPYPVVKTVTVPVEKHIPYPVIKHVPYPVHVPKPYPVHVPVYKHIYHTPKIVTTIKTHSPKWSW